MRSKEIETVVKKYQQWLLELQPFQLEPVKLINAGYGVSLMPFRGDSKLDLEHTRKESLPTLDLRAVGITPNFEAESTFIAVRSMLKGRLFVPEVAFDLIHQSQKQQICIVTFMFEQTKVQLKASLPFFLNPGEHRLFSDLDKAEQKLFSEENDLAFALRLLGDPILGLDLSKSIRAFGHHVVNFLLPFLAKNSAEANAFSSIFELRQAHVDDRILMSEFDKRLASRSKWLPWRFTAKQEEDFKEKLKQSRSHLENAIENCWTKISLVPSFQM